MFESIQYHLWLVLQFFNTRRPAWSRHPRRPWRHNEGREWREEKKTFHVMVHNVTVYYSFIFRKNVNSFFVKTKNIRRKWERRTRMLSESRGEGLQKRVSLSHVNGMYKKPVFLLSLTFHRKHRRGCLVWDTFVWTGFTFNWNVPNGDASAMFLMNATFVSDKRMSATHRNLTRYFFFAWGKKNVCLMG